jgi:hypothetical protein
MPNKRQKRKYRDESERGPKSGENKNGKILLYTVYINKRKN